MIVVDASAVVELLIRLNPVKRDAVATALAGDGHWVVPEHFRLEAANAFRGLWLGGILEADEFDDAVAEVAAQHLDVWPTAPLLPRIRELAPNATAYDAAYLALAEELGCPLLTVDAKFARVPGVTCRVVVAG